MRHVVKLPRLGETADDVVVLEWLVDVGSSVASGDPLMRVETDKVEADVPAPAAGVVVERLVEEGDDLETGAAICVITG